MLISDNIYQRRMEIINKNKKKEVQKINRIHASIKKMIQLYIYVWDRKKPLARDEEEESPVTA